MMGRESGDQAILFYEFRLDDRVPKNHLLRRIMANLMTASGQTVPLLRQPDQRNHGGRGNG